MRRPLPRTPRAPLARARRAALTIGSLLACAGVACGPQGETSSSQQSGTATAGGETPAAAAGANLGGETSRTEVLITEGPAALTDQEIEEALRNRLLTDPQAPLTPVEVTVEQGVVTLSGTVDDLLARRRAVAHARSLKGVRSVIDRLEVEKARLPDSRIVRAVRELLAYDPATSSLNVDVSVDDGEVRLQGKVESFAERELAEQTAASALGVTAIDNDLTLEVQPTRSDEELEAEIRGLLAADVRVADGSLEVQARNGNVTLSGTVGSAAERARAIRTAWVRGVKEVDAEPLEVEWWARDRFRRSGKSREPDDALIAESVKNALEQDPRVPGAAIDVRVREGVVHLEGDVPTLSARAVAVDTAGTTAGVWRVHDFLSVVSPDTLDDATVEARVERALLGDAYLANDAITVNVDDGVVTLKGAVDNAVERDRARQLAGRIGGVSAVVGDLQAPDEADEAKSDWEIHQDLQNHLFWSFWVDEKAVDITVNDGIVTLRGSVDDWPAYAAALESARNAGARRVEDRLRIADAPSYIREHMDDLRPVVPVE